MVANLRNVYRNIFFCGRESLHLAKFFVAQWVVKDL